MSYAQWVAAYMFLILILHICAWIPVPSINKDFIIIIIIIIINGK